MCVVEFVTHVTQTMQCNNTSVNFVFGYLRFTSSPESFFYILVKQQSQLLQSFQSSRFHHWKWIQQDATVDVIFVSFVTKLLSKGKLLMICNFWFAKIKFMELIKIFCTWPYNLIAMAQVNLLFNSSLAWIYYGNISFSNNSS